MILTFLEGAVVYLAVIIVVGYQFFPRSKWDA